MKRKRIFLIFPIIFLGMTLFVVNSCKKDKTSVPVMTTTAVSGINQTSANSGGNISDDGGAAITARGVCWSTSQTPDVGDNKTTDGSGTGNFTSAITGLSANTTYYLRAYATNSSGTGYGNAVSFTTLQGSVNTVTDIDGNVYNTVTIGTQIWMKENLNVIHYRNGDPIPVITGNAEWAALTTGACCEYNNSSYFSDIYGRIYNGYSVTDSRNIAPAGWHVATDADWTTLTTFLGGESVAGGKLKSTGTSLWDSPNTGATDEFDFSALPGGYRENGFALNGSFEEGNGGYWWASDGAYYRRVFHYAVTIQRNIRGQVHGHSVRCVKD